MTSTQLPWTGKSTRSKFLPLLLSCVALFSSASACKQKKESCNPGDIQFEYQLVLQSSDALNPDAEGQALPVTFRLYQLSGPPPVETLSFEEVWQDAKSVFGGNLVAEEEFTVFPTQDMIKPLVPKDGTTHLVAVGIFRQPVGSTWYTTYELPSWHGSSVCAAKDSGKPGLANPCFYVSLDQYSVDGGASAPPSFDNQRATSANAFQCAPPSKKPTQNPAEQEQSDKKSEKKKWWKKAKDAKAPETPSMPEAPNAPSAPETPSVPNAPSAPSKPDVPTAPDSP